MPVAVEHGNDDEWNKDQSQQRDLVGRCPKLAFDSRALKQWHGSCSGLAPVLRCNFTALFDFDGFGTGWQSLTANGAAQIGVIAGGRLSDDTRIRSPGFSSDSGICILNAENSGRSRKNEDA